MKVFTRYKTTSVHSKETATHWVRAGEMLSHVSPQCDDGIELTTTLWVRDFFEGKYQLS